MTQQDVPKKPVAVITPEAKSSRPGKRSARRILLLAASAGLSPENQAQVSLLMKGPVDWDYLVELAEYHGVAPLVAHNLTAGGLDLARQVPPSILERLNTIYSRNLFKNVLLADELGKILSAFDRQGIPVISLKGTVLAEMLYANPGLRTVSDIDILVQPENLTQAGSLLLDMGYRQMYREQTKDHPFHEQPYGKPGQFPFFVELHWDMDNPREVTIPQQEIWEHARRLTLQAGTALVMSPENTLLYLSNNLSKPANLLLKPLCDLTELLKKYKDILDWDYILGSARSWHLETPVYYALRQARALLGAPVPEFILQALKPAWWRRCAIGFLMDRKDQVSPAKWKRLRYETSVLIRSLMMSRPRRMLAVISKYRGYGKRAVWLRTIIWVVMVFGSAAGRNIAGLIIREV